MSSKSKIRNDLKPKRKLDLIQSYTTYPSEYCGYNEKIGEDFYNMNLCLSTLLSRKNMAFKKLVNRINYYFLVEFICIILQEQKLWTKKICDNGTSCNIKKILSMMDFFP